MKNLIKKYSLILIAFLIGLGIIYVTGTGNINEIVFIFAIHLVADIFIIKMGDEYTKGNMKKGFNFQVLSYIMFTVIFLFNIIVHNNYDLLLSQFLFLLPIIATLFNLKIMNVKTNLLIGIVIFFVALLLGKIVGIGSIILSLGFIIFPAFLVAKNNMTRIKGATLGITLITLGSLILLVQGYINGHIIGSEVSFFLLSFAVLIEYIKMLIKKTK